MSQTTLGLCSMVPSSTLNQLTKFPKADLPADPVAGYPFFPGQLSSAVGFDHPGHQGRSGVTQQEVVYVWPSLPHGFCHPRSCHPRSWPSNLLKICASEQEPLDPDFPQETVFCAHQGQEIYGKEALVVVIVTACFLWLLHGNMLSVYGTYNMGDIPSGSKLLLYPFLLIRAIRAVQIFVLKFSKDGSADLGDQFASGGATNQPTSGIARRYRSLQWPGVSEL